MKFFKSYLAERRRKKFYSDLKSRRIADDDILSDEIKEKFDNLLLELNVKGTGDAAIEKATTRFNALKLKPYGKMRNILDLLIVVGSVAFGIRGLFFQPFQMGSGTGDGGQRIRQALFAHSPPLFAHPSKNALLF